MKSMKVDMKKYSLILILIGMMIVCSLLNSSFMSGTNLMNILKQVSIVTICSFAQGMIIITGDIDLSIGYLAGMAGTFACIVFVATQNLFLAFMVGVLIGAVVGAINGLFVAYFKLPAFMPLHRRSERLQDRQLQGAGPEHGGRINPHHGCIHGYHVHYHACDFEIYEIRPLPLRYRRKQRSGNRSRNPGSKGQMERFYYPKFPFKIPPDRKAPFLLPSVYFFPGNVYNKLDL